jgi:hypothetical protein
MPKGYNEKGSRPMVKCYCPCCETYHKMRLNWTGRGIPRKICKTCQTSDECVHVDEFAINDRAIRVAAFSAR